MDERSHFELERRTRDLERRLDVLTQRVEAFEETLDRALPVIDRLDVARQVADALEGRASSIFTRRQKLGAGAVAIASLALQSFALFHQLGVG